MIESADDRINFLIHFARMNLKEIREGDLINLKEDLNYFISKARRPEDMAGLCIELSKGQLPSEWSITEIKSIQSRIEGILKDIVHCRELMKDMHERGSWSGIKGMYGIGPTIQSKYYRLPSFAVGIIHGIPDTKINKSEARFFAVSINPIEAFHLIALFLLVSLPIDRILICPICHKLFLKKAEAKKMIFCSVVPCQRKAINARYIENQEKLAKESSAGKGKTKPALIRRSK